jgi:hypothetical protein
VGIEGEFSMLQESIVSLAGVALPLALWVLFLSLAPRKTNIIFDSFKVIGSLAVINTLLAWIIIPVLYPMGSAPGDDSVNFIRISGVHPLAVTGGAVLLSVAGWVFFVARMGGRSGLSEYVARLRHTTSDFVTPAALRTLAGLLALGVATALLSTSLGNYLKVNNPAGLPSGYTQVMTTDLRMLESIGKLTYSFTLDEPTDVSFYIILQDIKSGPLDITLSGPNGYRNTFARFGEIEAPGMGRATVHPKALPLVEGEYHLTITVPSNPGRITVATDLKQE